MENKTGMKLKALWGLFLSLSPYLGMTLVLVAYYFWWPEIIRLALIGVTALAWLIKIFK